MWLQYPLCLTATISTLFDIGLRVWEIVITTQIYGKNIDMTKENLTVTLSYVPNHFMKILDFFLWER